MTLLGMEVSQRETVLLGVTLGVAVIFGLYLLSKSTGGAGDSPADFYASLDASSSRLNTSLMSVSKLKKNMNIGKFFLPSTDDSARVMTHIDKVARASGLNFPALTATAPKKGRRFQTINYRFSSTSNLNALVKFVDEIQKGEYLICLENWDMKPAEASENISANLSLRAYFAPAEGGRK